MAAEFSIGPTELVVLLGILTCLAAPIVIAVGVIAWVVLRSNRPKQ